MTAPMTREKLTAPDQDWAASWPGRPGFYAIGSDLRDAEKCRREGGTISIVSRAEAVVGHRVFLESRNVAPVPQINEGGRGS